jgi:hypothetical protein
MKRWKDLADSADDDDDVKIGVGDVRVTDGGAGANGGAEGKSDGAEGADAGADAANGEGAAEGAGVGAEGADAGADAGAGAGVDAGAEGAGAGAGAGAAGAGAGAKGGDAGAGANRGGAGKMGVLRAMEQVVGKMRFSKFSAEALEAAKPYTDYLSQTLLLTPMQCIFLSVLLEITDSSGVGLIELSKFFDCSKTRMLYYSSELDELVRMNYVTSEVNDDIFDSDRKKGEPNYFVPIGVVKALKENRAYKPEPPKVVDCYALFDCFDRLFQERVSNALREDVFQREILRLLDANQQLDFVAHIKNHHLEINDMIMLIYFCKLFFENRDDEIGSHDVRGAFDNRDFQNSWGGLVDGVSKLLTEGCIESANEDGIAEPGYFKLTENAKRELLGELHIISIEQKASQYLIQSSSLHPKELFYDRAVGKQVDELTEMLGIERFNQIQKSLDGKGMRNGFACLFYGAPGTGKTETVNQIAIRTGRDLMPVNVTDIQEMWVGASERNMRGVFEKYRELAKTQEKKPILLFNEADAVISKRMQIKGAVDKMENSVQNIILEEMEKLDGIMIATTNLVGNIDTAFERRFIYKIEFTKPTLEARKAIWKSMLPELTDGEAQELALKYSFSGGQIENVTRKVAVKEAIFGYDKIQMADLLAICDAEKSVFFGQARAMGKIGY